MIDVSRFHAGQPCPRCPGRRVYAVDIGADRWCCVPNAMPVPWLREHILEHDATASCDDPASALELVRAAQLRTQVIPYDG